MARNFVSVSGVGQIHEIEAINEHVRDSRRHTTGYEPDIFVGIQASAKSLVTRTPTVRGEIWYPSPETTSELLSVDKGTVRKIIHFAYAADERDDKTMHDLTWRALDTIDTTHLIGGWQFNGPDWGIERFPKTVTLLRERLRHRPYLIANIGSRALERMTPRKLTHTWRGSRVDCLLLDISGGLGLDFDVDQYLPYIEEISTTPGLDVAIAGGLGDEAGFDKIARICREYPHVGVDAESKLRDFPDDTNTDTERLQGSRLNLERTKAYINRSSALLETARRFESEVCEWNNFYGVPEEQQRRLLKLHRDHWDKIRLAPGSTHNHQAWEGGYLKHISDIKGYLRVLYTHWEQEGVFDSLPSQERFTFEDALVVGVLHDIEKPFATYVDEAGDVKRRDEFKDKAARAAFREQLIEEYGIELTPMQQNALRYAEGIRDADYTPNDRVMSPMAALVHAADLLSARGSYNLGRPKSGV